MIAKTDKYIKRYAKVWVKGFRTNEEVTEYVRKETWWLFWFIPVYSRETVVSKPQ